MEAEDEMPKFKIQMKITDNGHVSRTRTRNCERNGFWATAPKPMKRGDKGFLRHERICSQVVAQKALKRRDRGKMI